MELLDQMINVEIQHSTTRSWRYICSEDEDKEGDNKDEEEQNDSSDIYNSVSDVSDVKMVDDLPADINGPDKWDLMESIVNNKKTVSNHGNFDDNLLDDANISQ